MGLRITITWGENHWYLYRRCRFLYADLVRFLSPRPLLVGSSLSRGARVSILLTVVRITPWNLQRKMLLCTRTPSQVTLLQCADLSSLGVVVFFVLQFAMLITQMFWVCELTYTGWKQIPGSICLVPPVVPISLVISELTVPLPPPFICPPG